MLGLSVNASHTATVAGVGAPQKTASMTVFPLLIQAHMQDKVADMKIVLKVQRSAILPVESSTGVPDLEPVGLEAIQIRPDVPEKEAPPGDVAPWAHFIAGIK